MADTSAPPRGNRVLLGRWGTPLIVSSALAVLGSFVFAWGWIANDVPTAPVDMIVTLLPLALLVIILSLLATARIVGRSDGYIEVVGLLITRRIPVSEVVDVTPRGPLKIRMRSGRRVGSIAYGQSLLGEMVGYPRSREAAERIGRFCRQVEARGGGGEAEYSVSLRGGEILASLLLGSLLVAVTVLMNQS